MKQLTEFKSVSFPSELEISTDKNEHTAGRTRRLTIDSRDLVLALLEIETGEFSSNILSSLDLLSLKGQHGTLLIQIGKSSTVAIKSRVVVLNESLGHSVWIHIYRSSPLLIPLSSRQVKMCVSLGNPSNSVTLNSFLQHCSSSTPKKHKNFTAPMENRDSRVSIQKTNNTNLSSSPKLSKNANYS